MMTRGRASILYQDAIPCRFAGMPCVNAGPILRAMLKLCKLFLKQKVKGGHVSPPLSVHTPEGT